MTDDEARATRSLGERLLDPACYPHPVGEVRLVETHISWVLLTGTYAYKVKKPVSLPFLDFSSAAARLRFCEEELRVNRRLAPELYLAVVPITGDQGGPHIDGDGEPFEHAVKMLEFDESEQLDRRLARGELDPAAVREAGTMIARFHARADVARADSPFASPAQVRDEALANLDALEAGSGADPNRLSRLRAWTESTLDALAPAFSERRAAGRVRECHGDLHLANMTAWRGRVLAFDALEFDERLRWIDVMSDVAFTMMDLLHRAKADLAYAFLDAYLQDCGDHAGIAVLRHYLVYRALVRAKIAAIRTAETDDATARSAGTERDALVDLATRLALHAPRPMLVAMHGPSGSGKSHLAARLLAPLGAVRLRSDVERRRLFPDPESRYAPGASARTYQELAERAGELLARGWPVIVDATCLEARWRALLRATARALGVPFAIVSCHADTRLLRSRVAARERSGDDASEATTQVLERQLASGAALAGEERLDVVEVDTHAGVDAAALACRLAAKVPHGR